MPATVILPVSRSRTVACSISPEIPDKLKRKYDSRVFPAPAPAFRMYSQLDVPKFCPG
jgi:hypothetical protein